MKRVCIVGMGALGSNLVQLARNWDAELTVIDYDTVEDKNTLSQFHTKMVKGKNKAKAVESAMRGLWRRPVKAVPVKLTQQNRERLLGGFDLIVDCTDNIEARTLIQDFAAHQFSGALHGCLSADGLFARVVWTEDFKADPEGAPGQATCEDGRNLPFHVFAAAAIAQVAQLYLTKGIKESYQLTAGSLIRLK